MSSKTGCRWLVIAGCCLLGACGTVSQAWRKGRDEAEASNHLMLVRKEPGTLGYRRLMVKSEELPDLKIFIGRKGLPDFMAEANSSGRNYLIFYYLGHRQAFACRTSATAHGPLEFAGPYAMTKGESRTLNVAKTKADTAAAMH